jgi:tRNA(Ile)-lysidine synthase
MPVRRPPDDAVASVREALSRSLDAHVPRGAPLALGFSGGRDSAVLLDALAVLASSRGHKLTAIHVHHGLSPNADAWEQFCAARCAELGVACLLRRVDVDRRPRTSIEAAARRARHEALADAAREIGVSIVALAHHRNDQVETLLLQLLRGAGPHGLAAMPAVRNDASGVVWWRPLLGIPRDTIDAYACGGPLAWIDDESNADERRARNAVRHSILPALRAIAPQADATLARAAGHQAEAARLQDDLAQADAEGAVDGATMSRDALAALAPHRARNLLRWFMRCQGLPAPSAARLAAMLDQLRGARTDSQLRLSHAGVEIGVHRGRIMLHASKAPAFDVPWRGESLLALPHGTLEFRRAQGAGIDAQRMAQGFVRVRARTGGERFQATADRPRRALKAVLRDAGIPAWERQGLPLIFCGDTLVAVPGVGVDAAFRAGALQPGLIVAWHPKPA